MKKILLAFTCITSFCLSQNEPPKEYFILTKKAFEFYTAKDYKNSGLTYSKAFAANGGKASLDDRYNAACSWALAGYPDSAFFNLNRAVLKGKYRDYNHITTDTDLTSLYKDKRWKPLIDSVIHNKDIYEAKFNKPVLRTLDTILASDQKFRNQLDELDNNGVLSAEEKNKRREEIFKNMMEADAINLKKVLAIIDKYGWLGPEEIGNEGNSTLFLVIQHSNQTTQEKYLPVMREAVKNKKAQPWDLALLEDRVLLGQGKKQIYGSQLTTDFATGLSTLSPIEDEINVNKRRAEVGLEPIEDYLEHFGITYKYDPNKKQPETGEERNRKTIYLVISVLALYLITAIVLFIKFKKKMLSSVWFWFFSILLFLDIYNWYHDMIHMIMYEPVKWCLYRMTSFSSTLVLIFCLNFIPSFLIKRKHFLIEVIAVGLGSYLTMLFLNSFIYNTFYPVSGMHFIVNIFGVIIPVAIFVGIKLIIWLILKYTRKTIA